jgi:hypothetical protein
MRPVAERSACAAGLRRGRGAPIPLGGMPSPVATPAVSTKSQTFREVSSGIPRLLFA